VQHPALSDTLGDLRRLAEGKRRRLLDRACRGGPDLAADAGQSLAQRAAEVSPGIRATPIRQPPRARLLLSAVVTAVRSGAK
jgi:hypothetical protein